MAKDSNKFHTKKDGTKARIKAGSGEKMKTAGAKGSPTKANFTRAAQTAKKV